MELEVGRTKRMLRTLNDKVQPVGERTEIELKNRSTKTMLGTLNDEV